MTTNQAGHAGAPYDAAVRTTISRAKANRTGRQVMNAIRFNAMHFMPYSALPDNYQSAKSLWVDYSNKNFDPAKGRELYDRYLKDLVLADQLGFDAIVVNE